jgi:hypothetical protein
MVRDSVEKDLKALGRTNWKWKEKTRAEWRQMLSAAIVKTLADDDGNKRQFLNKFELGVS